MLNRCLRQWTRPSHVSGRPRVLIAVNVRGIPSQLSTSLQVNRKLCSEGSLFFSEGGVGGSCTPAWILTLAYYAFPRWYEFGERRWNDRLTGENRRTRRKTVLVPHCPPQIPHVLTRTRTRASAARGQRLTAWPMARPKVKS
jgi:hypothetical protein